MGLAFHIPPAPLNQWIECFWFINEQIPYKREKILPTGTVELMVNFGSPFRVYDKNDLTRFDLNTESWVAGLQTEYLINEPVGETHMLGIRFKPGGQYAFLKIPALELHNRVVPLDCLLGQFASELRERLLETPGVPAKFQLVQRVLMQRYAADTHMQAPVHYAIGRILRTDGLLSIRDLSDDIGMSQKHLASRFKQIVGVSPKSLARVFRFQNVLNNIDPTKPINWADVAYRSNYYDQAHFNHDFAAFTGMNPTDYVAYRRAVFGETIERGEDVHFVPIA